jgi:hypothetical protein
MRTPESADDNDTALPALLKVAWSLFQSVDEVVVALFV